MKKHIGIVDNNVIELDVSELQSGMYLVKIQRFEKFDLIKFYKK